MAPSRTGTGVVHLELPCFCGKTTHTIPRILEKGERRRKVCKIREGGQLADEFDNADTPKRIAERLRLKQPYGR